MTDDMQRAREFLAAEFERDGEHKVAASVLRGEQDHTASLRAIAAALRSAQGPEVNPLREHAKRNLRKLIELGSTDKALMLSNLEEL